MGILLLDRVKSWLEGDRFAPDEDSCKELELYKSYKKAGDPAKKTVRRQII
jgi:hypothetical protein